MQAAQDTIPPSFTFDSDSLSYHREHVPEEITDTLPAYLIHQVPPQEVYGRFSTMLAPVKNENQLSHLVEKPLWEGWLAIGIFFAFLVFFRYIMAYFRDGLRSLWSLRVLHKRYKENSLLMRNIRQVLLVFSMVVFAFWAYLILSAHVASLPYETWILYLLILAAILAYLLLKIGLLRILGVISASPEVFQMLNYSGQLYAIAAGILLFPFAMMFLLGGESSQTAMNIAGSIICGTAIILYLIRSLQIFYKAKFSIFFWILYLCTFEMAPFLVLYGFLLAN